GCRVWRFPCQRRVVAASRLLRGDVPAGGDHRAPGGRQGALRQRRPRRRPRPDALPRLLRQGTSLRLRQFTIFMRLVIHAWMLLSLLQGCDGSVLLESTPDSAAERDSPINNPSLRGFEVIDSAKVRLEAACPGVVSCADVLAYAARDSVALTGGPRYDVPGGRRDGTVSLESEVADNIPAPTFTLDELTRSFAAKGLTQEEMVTLSGAHTIGRAHCTSFSDRLYNFSAMGAADPSVAPAFLSQLRRACPAGPDGAVDANLAVPMEPRTPNGFDALYYWAVLRNRGLFTSDQALLSSPPTAAQVRQSAYGGYPWKLKFAAAMVKMGQVEVLTGSSGEIRTKCAAVN
uniref:Peroxidase n=1 Tax=Oryza brachyantha TaxID=4533 RepID=J3LJE0_ORYBR